MKNSTMCFLLSFVFLTLYAISLFSGGNNAELGQYQVIGWLLYAAGGICHSIEVK